MCLQALYQIRHSQLTRVPGSGVGQCTPHRVAQRLLALVIWVRHISQVCAPPNQRVLRSAVGLRLVPPFVGGLALLVLGASQGQHQPGPRPQGGAIHGVASCTIGPGRDAHCTRHRECPAGLTTNCLGVSSVDTSAVRALVHWVGLHTGMVGEGSTQGGTGGCGGFMRRRCVCRPGPCC